MNKHVQFELERFQERLENLKVSQSGYEKSRDAEIRAYGENIKDTREKIEHVEAVIEVLKSV